MGFAALLRAPQELEQAEQKLNEAIEEQEAGPSGVLRCFKSQGFC